MIAINKVHILFPFGQIVWKMKYYVTAKEKNSTCN